MNFCKKCNKEFEVSKGLINYCSLSCKNSRVRPIGFYRHSEEAKRKIKERNIERYKKDPDLKKRIGETLKRKIKAGEIIRVTSEETKKKMSNTRKKLLEEKPWLHPNVLCSNLNESYPEKVFREYLDSIGLKKDIDYIKQYKIEKYFIDFYFPKFNLGVEIDGERWHNLESEKEIDREMVIKKYIKLKRFFAKVIIKRNFESELKELIL